RLSRRGSRDEHRAARRRRPALALLSLALILLFGAPAAAGEARSGVVFSRDVLPILSDNCFQCHGPDPKARKAPLRLDTPEGALRTADPVIVPGKSAASELVRRISTGDPDEVMPPPKSNRKLTPGQVGLLKRWVDEGARWGKHWALERPQRPALPEVRDRTW